MKALRTLSTVVASTALVVAMVATASGLANSSASKPPTTKNESASAPASNSSVRSSVRSAPAGTNSATTSGAVDSRVLHRPDEQVDPGADTGHWSSMYEFMQYVVEDTAAVWNWYYQQWGYGSSSVNYVFPPAGETYESPCGPVRDDVSAFYCGTDDTIYASQGRAAWYWENAGGDFAVATMLAHEYGHNVQAELGISADVYGTPKHEQHADCYSGAFAHVAYSQGILDANDINEGLASRSLVGDWDFDNPGHHGTPEERMNAFMLGYNGDGPAVCDAILQG